MSRIYRGLYQVEVRLEDGSVVKMEPMQYEEAEFLTWMFGADMPFEGQRVIGAAIRPVTDAW